MSISEEVRFPSVDLEVDDSVTPGAGCIVEADSITSSNSLSTLLDRADSDRLYEISISRLLYG